LQWFVTEQVEEEKNVGDVVETLKRVGDKSEALFMLDRKLGGREDDPDQRSLGRREAQYSTLNCYALGPGQISSLPQAGCYRGHNM
jgi:hypothetical protein